jgi:hypothetical protein
MTGTVRNPGRRLRRAALWFLGAVALSAAGVTGLLAAPQPLFAYHVRHGNFELWSDQPIEQTAGEKLLADVQSRLNQSIFGGPQGKRRIFIANSDWRERLFFLWNRGAGGVNYFPAPRNAFLRRSDVTADRLFGPRGAPAEPPRTLAYFAAHELAHGLTSERAGAVAYGQMPRWLREGLADYAAFGPGRAKQMAGELSPDDPRLLPERAGLYLRYHLLVACARENAGLTLDQLLALRLPEADAASRWLEPESPGRNARACNDGTSAERSTATRPNPTTGRKDSV